MSTDIERLLTAAADDSDQPLHSDVDDILIRGRRSVRHRRIATIATATLTTAAVIGGVATWSSTRNDSAAPAGTSTATITIDVKTGLVIDDETGKPIAPAPPVSLRSDRDIITKCMVLDKIPTWDPRPWDKAGPLSSRWSVAVKTSRGHKVAAVLVAPDHSVAAHCQLDDDPKSPSGSFGRMQLTTVAPDGALLRAGYADGLRVPAAVGKILVDVPGEPQVRQALMGTDGFYTLEALDSRLGTKPTVGHPKPRIRGYSADGRKILDRQLPFVVLLPPVPEH